MLAKVDQPAGPNCLKFVEEPHEEKSFTSVEFFKTDDFFTKQFLAKGLKTSDLKKKIKTFLKGHSVRDKIGGRTTIIWLLVFYF